MVRVTLRQDGWFDEKDSNEYESRQILKQKLQEIDRQTIVDLENELNAFPEVEHFIGKPHIPSHSNLIYIKTKELPGLAILAHVLKK